MNPVHDETIDSDSCPISGWPKCWGVKMYGSVVVGTKGQIVIPSEVRKTLEIQPGDSMCVLTKHDRAVALIKMDDLDEFMEFMQRELNTLKRMAEDAERDAATLRSIALGK